MRLSRDLNIKLHPDLNRSQNNFACDIGLRKKIKKDKVKLFFIINSGHGTHWSTQIYSIIDLVEVHSGTSPYDDAAKQILSRSSDQLISDETNRTTNKRRVQLTVQ